MKKLPRPVTLKFRRQVLTHLHGEEWTLTKVRPIFIRRKPLKRRLK